MSNSASIRALRGNEECSFPPRVPTLITRTLGFAIFIIGIVAAFNGWSAQSTTLINLGTTSAALIRFTIRASTADLKKWDWAFELILAFGLTLASGATFLGALPFNVHGHILWGSMAIVGAYTCYHLWHRPHCPVIPPPVTTPSVIELRPPIGLHREEMNCWADALFQFLMNIPSYREALKKCPIISRNGISIEQMSAQYLSDQENNRSLATVDTQNFRDIFHTLGPQEFSEDNSQPQDPSHAFILLSDWLPKMLVETQMFSDKNSCLSSNTQRNVCLNLCVTTPGETLVSLIEKEFQLTPTKSKWNLSAKGSTSISPLSHPIKKLQTPPQDLSIVLQPPSVLNPTTPEIDVPFNLRLEKSKPTLHETGDYRLDSFILGLPWCDIRHYVAYIQKNGRWFLCDDSSIREVTEHETQQAARKAYLLHYSKII